MNNQIGNQPVETQTHRIQQQQIEPQNIQQRGDNILQNMRPQVFFTIFIMALGNVINLVSHFSLLIDKRIKQETIFLTITMFIIVFLVIMFLIIIGIGSIYRLYQNINTNTVGFEVKKTILGYQLLLNSLYLQFFIFVIEALDDNYFKKDPTILQTIIIWLSLSTVIFLFVKMVTCIKWVPETTITDQLDKVDIIRYWWSIKLYIAIFQFMLVNAIFSILLLFAKIESLIKYFSTGLVLLVYVIILITTRKSFTSQQKQRIKRLQSGQLIFKGCKKKIWIAI